MVVCANRTGQSSYRLQAAPPPCRATARAELAIAEGVSAAAETENVDVGGFPSNRAMIRLKVKVSSSGAGLPAGWAVHAEMIRDMKRPGRRGAWPGRFPLATGMGSIRGG